MLRFGARLFGFIDCGDFADLNRLGLLLDGSLGRLAAFCRLLGRSWGPLGASWDTLGEILGPPERILGPLGHLCRRLRGDHNITEICKERQTNNPLELAAV